MITVHNLKKEKIIYPYDIKIDRSSKYGNPYLMFNDSYDERIRVCNEYEELLRNDTNFSKKIEELLLIYKKYGKLRLFCWCTPKRCHGLSIKNYLEEKIKEL